MNAHRSRPIADLVAAAHTYLASIHTVTDDQRTCDIPNFSNFISGFDYGSRTSHLPLPNTTAAFEAGFNHARSQLDLADMPGVLHELLRDHLPGIYIAHRDNAHSVYNNFPLHGKNVSITLSSAFTFDINQLNIIANDFNKRFPRHRITFYFNRLPGNVIYLSITLSNV